MVEYTAEHVLNRLHAMQGHALTVAERAELFGLACDYATLLRERESAKAAVTDEPRNEFPLLYDNLDALDERAAEQPNRIATARILTELRHQIGYVMTKLHSKRAALEAVAPMLASARVPDDTLRLDAIKENSWDLMCFEMPTGAGDADIGWRVMEHYRADPELREVSVEYSDDPRKAIDSAMLVAATKPETEE